MMSIEDFETQCEPGLISLQAVKFEKKVIGSTIYTIRVEVGDRWGMVAEVQKTLE